MWYVQARLHRDEWDLSKCSPPAKLAWAASWAAWAAREGARDAQQGGKKAMERLSSGEDGSSNEVRVLCRVINLPVHHCC